MATLYRLVLASNINSPTTMQCLRFKCATAAFPPTSAFAMLGPKYRYVVQKSIQPSAVHICATVGLSDSASGQASNSAQRLSSTLFNSTQNRAFNLLRHYEKQSLSQHQQSLLLPQLLQDQKLRHYTNVPQQQNVRKTPPLEKNHTMGQHGVDRKLSSRQVTKNLTLYTKTPCNSPIDPKTLEIKEPTGNPLVLIMAWLMARPKHIRKYAELYSELGFDAIVVHVTPWQLLWPTKGTQMVAADTLNFLENNKSYSPIIMHGFSVGAYQFGEMMLMMTHNITRYQPLLDRFICQVWDSAADITEIPVGLPKSIFPKNPRMQNALRSYTLYHMKTFYNQATVHYMRSSQMFHSTLLKAPAIFFVSDNDAIGPPSSNQSVREDWERANIPVTFKCWERSTHAAHFMKHREEYLELLYKHLEASGVLETAGLKSRAKL